MQCLHTWDLKLFVTHLLKPEWINCFLQKSLSYSAPTLSGRAEMGPNSNNILDPDCDSPQVIQNRGGSVIRG